MKNQIGVIAMQFVRPFKGSDLGLFGKIRELGFDFVELLMPEPEDQLDLGDVRRALLDHELGVILAARVNAERSLGSSDAAAREGGIAYLDACIDAAAAVGANMIGGPFYGGPLVFAGRAPAPVSETERGARFERCVKGLSAAADKAAENNIRLALEPLNRFETDIVSTTAQAIELVDAIDSPALGLLLDSFHMNIEESSIADAIRLAGARIFHVQANENHRGFPGTGHIPWADICRALHDVAYEGPISLEPFRRDDDRFAVPIAQWRPPMGDESEKLRNSLAFIRAALHMAGHRR